MEAKCSNKSNIAINRESFFIEYIAKRPLEQIPPLNGIFANILIRLAKV